MKKACLALLLAAILGSGVGVPTARAADASSWPAGWLTIFGGWELYGTQIRTRSTQQGGSHDRSGTGAVTLFGNYIWADAKVSVKVDAATDVYSLLLRAQGAGNCVQFGRYGSTLQLLVYKNGQIIFNQTMDGGAITLPETIAAEIHGNAFTGYINGQAKFTHDFSDLAAGSIPVRGKVGLQTNHNYATFEQFTTQVFTTSDPGAVGRLVTVNSITLTENACGSQRLQVRVADNQGASDVMTVQCVDTVTTPSVGTAMALGLQPLQLVAQEAGNVGVWEGPFYSVSEGTHTISAQAYDLTDAAHQLTQAVNLTAKAGTYMSVGDKKLFENLDPHPVWRGWAADPQVAGTQRVSNYFWDLDAESNQVRLHPLTIEPDRSGKPYVGRQIIEDDSSLVVRPRFFRSGNELNGAITRHLGTVTNMFCIQPTYEVQMSRGSTNYGKLTWWARVFNGDPIVRFGGTFTATRSVTLTSDYAITNEYPSVTSLSPATAGWPAPADLSDNFILWRPADRLEGPVFAWAFNRRPSTSTLAKFGYTTAVTLASGQSFDLPMLALTVVDGHAVYSSLDLNGTKTWAAQLAHAALASPQPQAAYTATSADANVCHVTLTRPYDFLANDWNITDSGQLIALPWCAGTSVSATPPPQTGNFHSAFGPRPYAITKQPAVTLDLAMPNLTPDKVTPAYEPLTGDWLQKSVSCIEQLALWQLPDGTFSGYDRMDHYALARMTLGLMMAYKGLQNNPAEQAKIATMVQKSLTRMMGDQKTYVGANMSISKGFSGGSEEIAWIAGDLYEPFVLTPKWNQMTEMGAQVDQNLGHAHLLLTLLLYGHYVDPNYLKRPESQEKLRELIKFQWMSQDWNGDIWRVVVGGLDAAGAGDGFEEDLAMLLPRLAEMAGLEQSWHDLASRISAMKFGALRQFDYLPLNNEWGLEFLTPMHHPSQWTPESGWGTQYRGDVWWTGPATCSGIYGPWYAENIYKPIPDVFNHMWYDLLEEAASDDIRRDARHWLTVGGYCSEAQLIDPFLGAVKLLRAYDIAKQYGYLTSSTRGEWIWNFAFYPAAMTVIQHELLARYPFMKDGDPVAYAVTTPSVDQAPAYAWKLKDGAVVSVAAYRLSQPLQVNINVNSALLGLSGTKWRVTDLQTGATSTVKAGAPISVKVSPRSATTLRLTPVPKSAVRDALDFWE